MSRINAPAAPIVAAWRDDRNRPGRGPWLLEVRCPYCTKIHYHGGGSEDAPSGLGHRVPHCQVSRPNDGYIVTDPDHLLTKATT
jgi:hypothetical protein